VAQHFDCSKNYYEILGVKFDASQEDVESAFRKLAKQYHPDVYHEPDAEKKMKDINEAKAVLCDENRRHRYNSERKVTVNPFQHSYTGRGTINVWATGTDGTTTSSVFSGDDISWTVHWEDTVKKKTEKADMHEAIKANNVVRVAELLDSGEWSAEAVNTRGNSLLHLAVHQASANMLRILIDRGVDVNVVNPLDKSTPLHRAAYAGRYDMIEVLLEKGADTEVKDKNGYTPLAVTEIMRGKVDKSLNDRYLKCLGLFVSKGKWI